MFEFPLRYLLSLVCTLPFTECIIAQTTQPNAPTAFSQEKTCTAVAQAAVEQRDYQAAKPLLTHLLATNKDCAEAHFLLAYVLLRQNLPKESLAEYTLAAKVRTPSGEDLRNVALDYVLLNDYPDASRWATRSLEMNNRDPETWYVLGRIKYNIGDFRAAVESFQHSLALAPKSVKAEDNLGLALEGVNESEKAIAAYKAAISLQADSKAPSEQPLLNLASLLIHRSQLDDALPLLLQASTIAPKEPKVHEQLGQLYTHQKKLPEALKEYEKAVSLAPSDSRLHYLLGQAYRHSQMNKQAEQEFATSARLNGTHSTQP